MFGSDILETAMGLVFVYLVFSLVCSGFREWIAVILNTRAKTLKKGVSNLLKDKDLMAHVFNHHLVRVKGGNVGEEKGSDPKYISSKAFAEALLEGILKAQKDEGMSPESSSAQPSGTETKTSNIEEIKKSIAKIENLKVKTVLNDLIENVEKKAEGWEKIYENAQCAIKEWFDDEMELISAWYKRETHKVLFVLGVILCILFNVDTIMITRTLSVNSALRESLTKVAMQNVQQPVDSTSTQSYDQGKKLQEEIGQLGLPIGWKQTAADNLDPRGIPHGFWEWLYKIFGLAMSILAVSMGATFWFDILKKLINLSGVRKNQEPTVVPA